MPLAVCRQAGDNFAVVHPPCHSPSSFLSLALFQTICLNCDVVHACCAWWRYICYFFCVIFSPLESSEICKIGKISINMLREQRTLTKHGRAIINMNIPHKFDDRTNGKVLIGSTCPSSTLSLSHILLLFIKHTYIDINIVNPRDVFPTTTHSVVYTLVCTQVLQSTD